MSKLLVSYDNEDQTSIKLNKRTTLTTHYKTTKCSYAI